MLKYADYDIVFQEIPDEVTLAINLSGCPNRCKGCHSPHLQEDIGKPLTIEALERLLARYGSSVTCVCLMGGDGDPQAVAHLATYLHREHPSQRTAWYSGRTELPADFPTGVFDYIKLGAYVESLGGLRSPATNQRLYRLTHDGAHTDLTHRFQVL